MRSLKLEREENNQYVEKIWKRYEKEMKIGEEKLKRAEKEKRAQTKTIADLEERVDKLIDEARVKYTETKAEEIAQKRT